MQSTMLYPTRMQKNTYLNPKFQIELDWNWNSELIMKTQRLDKLIIRYIAVPDVCYTCALGTLLKRSLSSYCSC